MERALTRRRIRKRPPSPDESQVIAKPGEHHLAVLQQHLGNRAVQQLLAQQHQLDSSAPVQRQSEEEQKEEEAQQPPSIGEIKIEKAEVEYYDIQGETIDEVIRQIQDDRNWYQYKYEYQPKIKDGLVTQVDIRVLTKIRVPRWIDLDWQKATNSERERWLQVLESFPVHDDKFEDETELPQQWLLGPAWKDAPDVLKNSWRGLLQSMQIREESLIETIRRRAMTLQKRLVNQPEAQVKEVLDKFIKEVEQEQEQYNRQRELGRRKKVSLNVGALVQ
jgi:hypothetical protein